MRATTLLYRQHRRIAQLSAVLEFENGMRNPLLLELVEELTAHIALEHNLFYPAAQRALDISVDAHREAHDRAKRALASLASSGSDSAAFVAKIRELRTIVHKHASLDESKIFPAMERALDEDALTELGSEMEAFQGRLLSVCRTRGDRISVRPTKQVTRARDRALTIGGG
jgi:hypothetical protein